MANLEFAYDGMPVGYFEESSFPQAAGRFRYMPCRGRGHLEMHEAVRRDQRAVCTFRDGEQLFEIVVDGVPESGVLSIASVSPVSSSVRSEATRRKQHAVAYALLTRAAERIGARVPTELQPSGSMLHLAAAESRELNVRLLDLLDRETSHDRARGGFWRDLVRACELLDLPARRELFHERFREAIRRVGRS